MTAITTTAYECNNYAVITTTACNCSGGRGGVGGRVYADLGYNTSTLNNYLYITQFTTACTLHTLELIVCYTLYDYLYTTHYTTTCIKSVAAGAGMGGRVYADLGADELFKRAQVSLSLSLSLSLSFCLSLSLSLFPSISHSISLSPSLSLSGSLWLCLSLSLSRSGARSLSG